MAEGAPPDSGDRTEAATPRRLERAREEGQVALSREAVGFATLLATTLAAALALPPLALDLMRTMRGLLADADPAGVAPAALALLRSAGLTLLPVLAAAAVAAVLATLAQTGGHVRGAALAPDLARLNPLAALKRILGPDGLVDLLRSLVKLVVVGAALWQAVELPELQAALHLPPGALLQQVGQAALRLLMATLAAFAVIVVKLFDEPGASAATEPRQGLMIALGCAAVLVASAMTLVTAPARRRRATDHRFVPPPAPAPDADSSTPLR